MSNNAKEKINKELSSIEPDTLIELFEIDFSSLQNHVDMLKLRDNLNLGAEPIYRFHAGKNSSNPIYWRDNGYQPIPIEIEDLETKSDGTLPRPKITLLNMDGLLSKIVSSNDDFVGCRVTRIRTFAKFLDGQNYQNRNLNESGENPFGRTDPQAQMAEDIFFINRKVAETQDIIQFELATALELGSTTLPGRIVLSNYCTWKYRCSIGCRYAGLPKADTNDKPFVMKRDITQDDKGRDQLTFPDEGWGLNQLNVKNMDEVFEWNKYGIKLEFESSGRVWRKGTIQSPYGYQRGDVVKLSPSYSANIVDDVPMVFVCLMTHGDAVDYHPLVNSNVWIKDSCSRSLNGCISRFGYDEDGTTGAIVLTKEKKPMRLPFGGFPGTSVYGF